MALHNIFDDAFELFVQGIDYVHAIIHAVVHVAHDLLAFKTQEYRHYPPVPGVEDGTLIV